MPNAAAYQRSPTRQRTIRLSNAFRPALPLVRTVTMIAARKGPKAKIGPRKVMSNAYKIQIHHASAKASTKNEISGCPLTNDIRGPPFLTGHSASTLSVASSPHSSNRPPLQGQRALSHRAKAQRHDEHPHQDRDVGEPLGQSETDAEVEADHRQDNHQYDHTGQRKSGKPKRPPPLVFAHAQRQEDHGDREAEERHVADDVVDRAARRSFRADIDREERR